MILIPDDLAAAERLWREDAQAQLAAVEHYLSEGAALFEHDTPTPYQMANRRAFEGLRTWLMERLSGVPEYLTNNDMRRELHDARDLPTRSVRARVKHWTFGELTGRAALHADCVREMRFAGPGYGYQWRKRLLERYDAAMANKRAAQ